MMNAGHIDQGIDWHDLPCTEPGPVRFCRSNRSLRRAEMMQRTTIVIFSTDGCLDDKSLASVATPQNTAEKRRYASVAR